MQDSKAKLTPADILAPVPIFAGLSDNERSFLAQRVVPRHYGVGEVVFSEGEPCAGGSARGRRSNTRR